MLKKHDIKRLLVLSGFLIGAFAVGILSTLLNNGQARTTSAFAAEADDSCREGVYYVKNPDNTSQEISCGRGVCDGVSYSETAGINYSSAGKCWIGSGDCGPACKGLVPLCCYKMAETGDAEDCPFPERKYCRQDQCKRQTKNEDSNCGSGIKSYCVDIPNCLASRDDVPVLSLEDRLAGKKTPVSYPPTQPPANTATPQPQAQPTATATPKPQQGQNPPTQTPVPTQANNTGENTFQSGVTRYPIVPPSTTPVRPRNTVAPNNSLGRLPELFDRGNSEENESNQTDETPLPGLPQQNEEEQEEAQSTETNQNPPTQIFRGKIDQSTVEQLNRATDPPLIAAERTLVTIQSYDAQLERTVERWIFSIRDRILGLF